MVPGIVIAFITFPGVIIYQILRRFCLDLMHVPVYEASYFDFAHPTANIAHEKVNNLFKAYVIAVGPFIGCSALSFLLGLPIALLMSLSAPIGVEHWIIMWIAISIGMHAFPVPDDMDTLHECVRGLGGFNLLLPLSWMMLITVKIARFLRVVWFDAIYAGIIAFAIPLMVIRMV